MKFALGACYGFALALVYILVGGVSVIQSIGVSSGAVLNLQNDVVGITSARTPVFLPISLAILGLLVMLVLLEPTRRGLTKFGTASLVTYAVSIVIFAVWAATIRDPRVPEPTIGIPVGWEGWLQRGGTNPAAHLTALLTLAVLWFRSSKREQRSLTAP